MIYRILVLLTVVLSFLNGCGEDNPANSSKSPQISVILPDSAKTGEFITISGNNFGNVQDSSAVYFNDLRATYIASWVDKEIQLKVPENAKSGKVTVVVNKIKSNEFKFKVIDVDSFESVTIGSQIWMKRNLDVEFYRNGERIKQVHNKDDWIIAIYAKEAAWCYYDYNSANGTVYGKLYNWYAVNDNRGLAPKGWHVSTENEWDILVAELGGIWEATDKLKETGEVHWDFPNKWATNSSGFTAIPGGINGFYGYSYDIGASAYWWTATDVYEDQARCIIMYANCPGANESNVLFPLDEYKYLGMSVRCIKD